MRLKFSTCTLLTLLVGLALGSAWPQAGKASDLAKEARWAAQIVDSLLDGDAVWLSDDSGHEFLGIYTEAESSSTRAVVLVHGIGVHPNWPDVIYPLRVGLLEHGVSTLSIQMPILENEAEESEYASLHAEAPARFDAALTYLAELGYDRVSLVAHSLGATMATYYLARNQPDAFESLVIVGMGKSTSYPGNIEALQRVRVPIFDLYGSEDLETVLESADERARSAQKRAGREYAQLRVDGANHFFQGHEAALLQQVTRWLDARTGR